MNKVMLIGRLVRDPNVRYSQGADNMAVAKLTLAVNRRGKKQENDAEQQTADFISCVCFSKLAEVAEKYLKQGVKIAIVGRLITDSYTNKEGQKVYTTEVAVDDIEFLEGKSQGSDTTQS